MPTQKRDADEYRRLMTAFQQALRAGRFDGDAAPELPELPRVPEAGEETVVHVYARRGDRS